jgi:hypothetical protein
MTQMPPKPAWPGVVCAAVIRLADVASMAKKAATVTEWFNRMSSTVTIVCSLRAPGSPVIGKSPARHIG